MKLEQFNVRDRALRLGTVWLACIATYLALNRLPLELKVAALDTCLVRHFTKAFPDIWLEKDEVGDVLVVAWGCVILYEVEYSGTSAIDDPRITGIAFGSFVLVALIVVSSCATVLLMVRNSLRERRAQAS